MTEPSTLANSTGARAAGSSGAFSPFEWMLSWRYLRARRKETFIAIIAGFSFVGILLGVAASILGILFFAPYLLLQIIRAKGDIQTVLVGA